MKTYTLENPHGLSFHSFLILLRVNETCSGPHSFHSAKSNAFLPSYKTTSFSLHLKMDHWKTILSLWVSAYFQVHFTIRSLVTIYHLFKGYKMVGILFTLRIQAPPGSNRILRLPIPSEKNRNVGVIHFLGHTWILRVFTMFKGDAEKNNTCVFAAVRLLSTPSQVEVVKRPPSWVVFVDVLPQLFGEDHPQLDLQIG